ncbi:hypothetical protein [Natronobiforma cellulositropha]|uniref:hypothetical protein n=1 Tax=Natronobiforma cellulositropha TaxID=1679076 RepID=UPI0021D5E3A2|nr:hypothetical protein [Natronobiforma cellulositropha]
MIEVPLQAIDNVMLPFHMGHVLLGALVLAVLAALPLKSMKILGLNVILVGTLFMLTPTDMAGETTLYRLMGVGLVVIGPMLYVAADS